MPVDPASSEKGSMLSENSKVRYVEGHGEVQVVVESDQGVPVQPVTNGLGY